MKLVNLLLMLVLVAAFAAFNPFARRALAQDASYMTKVYSDLGGNRLNVASGGVIKVYAGGSIDASAGALTLPTGQLVVKGTKTKSQLQAYTPGGRGELWMCSDCTSDGIVESTGATLGGLGRVTSLTTAFQ